MHGNEISVYVANLGRYNEGRPTGDWIDLPVSGEELDAFLKEKVGLVPGVYEEYAIHDYDFAGALKPLGFKPERYESLEDLNDLAWLVSDASASDLAAIKAAAENTMDVESALGLCNLAVQVDEIPFYQYDFDDPSMSPQEKLGRTEAAMNPSFASMIEDGYGHLIKYEDHGRELEAGDFFVYEEGYLDAAEEIPSCSLYSREQIAGLSTARALQAAFLSDPEGMKAWFDEKSSSLSEFASDFPCWGRVCCVGGPREGFVPESVFEKILPTKGEQGLYFALCRTEGIGYDSVFSQEEALASHRIVDAVLLEKTVVLPSAVVFRTELVPGEFSQEELIDLAMDHAELFDAESIEKWPELAEAAEKAQETTRGRRAHLRQVMSETAFGHQGYLQNAPWGSKESHEAYRSAQREYSSMWNVADEESGMDENNEKRGSSKRSPFDLAEKASEAYEAERSGGRGRGGERGAR